MENIADGPQKGQPPITAPVTALDTYPTAIGKVRTQRVADVMHRSGLLHSRFNVTPMTGL